VKNEFVPLYTKQYNINLFKVALYKDFPSNLPSENSCNFLNIASKLTNEVPFERRKIYLSIDYNIMIMQQLHN
jgi:hypothetical protein